MGIEINVAFVSDDNYFNYLFVTLESIVKNTSQKNYLNINIIDAGIQRTKKSKLLNYYESNQNVKINFIKIDQDLVSNFKTRGHISASAYAKVFLPKLIESDKVIYLDIDLILNDDIYKLYKEFEDDVILKAVWNPFYNYDNKYIGIAENDRTFNSGVMLLNLEMMREENAVNKLIAFLDENHDKTRLHDQAAFNAIFKGNWGELDYKWNYQVNMIIHHYKKLNLLKEKYCQLYKQPSIIHFNKALKPWEYEGYHPYRKYYLGIYEEIHGEMKFENKPYFKMMKQYLKYKYYALINIF